MRKSEVCDVCCVRAGEFNGNWKGGRARHHQGYMMVFAPWHPRATFGKRYVFEHTLVMEDFLGRRLLPCENVHHKNGVRDDNRLENLELWTKPQPPGIRAEDAVAWAKEVLLRYERTPLA